MEEDARELDITSEALSPSPPAAPDSASNAAPRIEKTSMRIVFACCRVYANLPIPEPIMAGKLKTWRVHCVRCGRLVEIPV